MRDLRGLVADAVERAAVCVEHELDARVRPFRDLLHLLERPRGLIDQWELGLSELGEPPLMTLWSSDEGPSTRSCCDCQPHLVADQLIQRGR